MDEQKLYVPRLSCTFMYRKCVLVFLYIYIYYLLDIDLIYSVCYDREPADAHTLIFWLCAIDLIHFFFDIFFLCFTHIDT